MNALSGSLAWPTRDPEWVSKILLMGLILLIPIIGQIVIWGWTLTALDNLRAGRAELPRASFEYIGRGVNIFVVLLVYGLALSVVIVVLYGIGLAILLSDEQGNPLGVLFFFLAAVAILLGILVLNLLVPPIVVATERGGIGGGLNVGAIAGTVGSDPSEAMYAGLFALLANLIGGVGAVVCCAGQIFTAPYGYAMLAWVVQSYEQSLSAGGAPPAGP